jgi:proteasome lid subunit RPN8/RPN11
MKKTGQDKQPMTIGQPQIIIDRKELEKIRWYVDKCDVEISGLGRIKKLPNGALFINKIYLLEQECTSGDTELDEDAVAKLLFESREDEGEMMFWWHSHHDMGAFWSGTDYQCIQQLGKAGMVVATVFNKKRETRTAIYRAGDDIAPDIFIDHLTLNTTSPLGSEITSELEREYEGKVTFPATTYYYNQRVNHSKGKEKKGSRKKIVKSTPTNLGSGLLEELKEYMPEDYAVFAPATYSLVGNEDFSGSDEQKKYWNGLNFLERKAIAFVYEEWTSKKVFPSVNSDLIDILDFIKDTYHYDTEGFILDYLASVDYVTEVEGENAGNTPN